MPDPVKKPISTIELLKGFQSSQTPLPSVEKTMPKAKDPWGSDVVDYDEFVKGMAGNAGGLQMPEQDDITQLKSQALTTRESLDNARKKLEEDYARQFTFPEMSYMQPGGQGSYNFESKEQSQAFYNLQDKKTKLDLAIRYLDRALNTPEEKKGAGKKAFQNELHNIISAGIQGMLDDIITARAAKQLSKGEQDDINEALIDAYGRLNQLNEIASKEVPRYRRASSIAGSIPYMEQFLMTGGIGTGAAGVAEKAGQVLIKKGITSKLGQAAVKRFVQPIIEGGVSMVGRVPVAPMTYANIAEESIGKLKEDGGKFYVDPDTMPSISKAIGKGVYNSAKEVFSESLGGMVALPKGLFPKALQEAISPAVKDFFKMVGMNNPFGEYYEELVSQALGGDNPFDPQFLKDLLVTIPVITGGFSALSIPAVASNMKVNADNRKVIEKFGLNSVNEVRDLIKANDSDGLVEKMVQLASVPGTTQKDHSNLLRYAASLVQDQTVKEFENPAPQAPLTQEEQDVEQIRTIGQKLRFNGTDEIVFAQDGELEPGQQPLVILSERDEPLTGKKVSIAVDLNELKQANWDVTKINPKFMPGDQLKQRKNVPVQQWIDDELNNYYTVKQQSDTMTAQMEAPVQEGETITLGDKTFNVTAVGTEGVQLNEIDEAGNITGATLNVTPDQYVQVFGQPAPIEGTEQVQPQAGTEATTAQPEVAQQVQAEPEPQLPVNKQGEIEYEKIQDPKAYAFGLTQEFGEEAPTVLDELIAEKTDALAKAKKASDAIQRARKTKSLNAEIARLNEVKAFFTPQTQEIPESGSESQQQEAIPEIKQEEQEPTEEELRANAEQAARIGEESLSEAENGEQGMTEAENEFIKQPTPELAKSDQKVGQKSPEAQLIKANNEVEPKPTEAQKEAGNYKKGHLKVQGMDITIENPAMSVRSGVDSDGEKWQHLMHNSYGYFRRTKGKDGDQIDVFLGDNLNSDRVYVIDQVDPKTGLFDEHKVMLGFNSSQSAIDGYLSNYEPGWEGIGSVSKMSIKGFKEWLGDGTRTKKPVDNNIKTKAANEPGAETTSKEAAGRTDQTPEPAAEQVTATSDKGTKEAAPKEGEKTFGEGNKVFTADAAQRARERMRRKLGELRSGIDPEMMQDGITLAGFYIEGGARKFTEYAGKMIADFGDAIKPYLKSFYNAVRDWPEFNTEGMTDYDEVRNTDLNKLGQEEKPKDFIKDHIIVASVPKVEQKPAEQTTKYTYTPISEKAFIVTGDTKPIKDVLKSLRGLWNNKHKAWMFKIADMDKVKAKLEAYKTPKEEAKGPEFAGEVFEKKPEEKPFFKEIDVTPIQKKGSNEITPRDGWRDNLIKAREYAKDLIPFERREIMRSEGDLDWNDKDSIVRAIDQYLKTQENGPEQERPSIEVIENKAEAIVSQAENVTDREQAGRIIEEIDGQIEEIEDQLKLIGSYSSPEGYFHEYAGKGPEINFKKDLVQYSKRLAKALGWEHDKSKKGKIEYANTNVPPAGGDGHIILWKPDSNIGVYISVPIEPSGINNYGGYSEPYSIRGTLYGGAPILWRLTTKEKKYSGMQNRYAPGDITVGEFKLLINKAISTYEKSEVEYAKRPDGTHKPKGEYTPEEWKKYTDSVIDKKLKKSPKEVFVDAIKDKITTGVKIQNTPALVDMAEKSGMVIGFDYISPKELYDMASLALNKHIYESGDRFNPSNKTPEEAKQIVQDLIKLQELLPTETQRSATQVDLQQYSTPPALSFLVNWIAEVNKKDSVLEPSAGEGNIAIFAKAAGAKVYVNEWDKNRADLLKQLDFERVTKEDAKILHGAQALQDVKITTVVMNPPFSRDVALGGKLDLHGAEKHMDAALSKLEPGGRLVAIVGKGMSLESPTHKPYWDKIKSNYSLRANILVNGDAYSKKGTSFDNRVIVIDKTGNPQENVKTVDKYAENYAELVDILNEIPEKSHNFTIAKTKDENTPSDSKTKTGPSERPVQPGSSDNTATHVGGIQRGNSGQSGTEYVRQGGNEPGGSVSPDLLRQSSTENVESNKQPENTGNIEQAPAGTNRGPNTGDINIRPVVRSNEGKSGQLSKQPENKPSRGIEGGSLPVIRVTRKKTQGFSNVGYDDYSPEITVEGAKDHPTKLVESTAMASVSLPETNYAPTLSPDIVKNGALSKAQLEDIILAGNAHRQTLPSGERRGFFLGAGTGYGKGRTIAGIILDNWNKGSKKAVWISKNDKAHRDSPSYWEAVGGDKTKLFVAKNARNKIGLEEGVLLTTYGTLRSGFDPKMTKGEEDEKKYWREDHKNRVQQIAQWLGKNFDGVIVFDESHEMANSITQKAQRGSKKPSMQALAGLELQRLLPKAKVIYSSATGATEVSNLVYAQRLGLWGDGTSFGHPSEFITAIENSGVAGMEIISKDLKSMGLYTAKTLSYDGVEYQTVKHNLLPEQKELYDKVAASWQIVLQNINEAIENNNTGKNAKSAALSAFWSAHQRFFSQIITTMEMPTVIQDMQKQLDSGKSVVVQMVNTNEAQLNRALTEAKSEAMENDQDVDLDELDLSPKSTLLEFIRKSFPVQMFEDRYDQDGNVVKVPVKDSEGNPVLNPDSIRKRDALIENISRELSLPESPMDIIINTFGADNVAEVTGRSKRVVLKLDKDEKLTKQEESRTDKNAAQDTNDFMDGKKRILIFSKAGGTGASFHSDLNRKNQQQRVHYVLQAGWQADAAIQGFGRSHRSNQRVAPVFKLVTTDLKAQMRFLSSIARRLEQLGALTKGQRDTGGQGVLDGSYNLENRYAKQALFQFYKDVEAGRVPGVDMPVLEDQMALKIYKEKDGVREYNEDVVTNTKAFLNRIMSLKVDLMNKVFDGFIRRLNDEIEAAQLSGSYDAGIESVEAENIRVLSEQPIYTDKSTKGQTYLTTFELTLRNNKRNWDVINNELDRYGERFKGFYQEETSGKVYAMVEQRIMDADGRYETKYKRMSVITDSHIESYDLYQKYKKIDNTAAKDLWDSEFKEYPDTRKKTETIVKGLILPIWNKLPDKINVKRYIDENGQPHLGRFFSSNDIRRIAEQFEVENSQNYPPQQIKEILNQGGTIRLSNGFEYVKTKYQGLGVIKIKNTMAYRDRDRLERAGVMFVVKSAMSMNGDFYIPMETAEKVLPEIEKLYNSSVVHAEDTDGNFIPAKQQNNSTNDISLLNETAEEYLNESNDGYSSRAKRKQAVDNAISAAERFLLYIRRGFRGSVYPKVQKRTVLKGFKESGYVDFVGQKIEGPQDIADLWSIHRSPYIEKTHLIFLKDGVILGSTAYTYNRAGISGFPMPEVVADLCKKFGADTVYLLHNHPSGRHRPSRSDVATTMNFHKNLTSQGINFGGHIVIDTTKFSLIDLNQRPVDEELVYMDELDPYINDQVFEFEYKNAVPQLFSERESVIDPETGKATFEKMFSISKALLTENNYKGAVIYLSSNMEVTAYDVFPRNAKPEDIILMAYNGIEKALGRSVVFIHDGSFKNLTRQPLPSDTLDVIDVSAGVSQYFRAAQSDTYNASTLNQLWEERREYKKSEFVGEYLEDKQDITQTPAFKKWFGNSKVVDENGRPLVVYHGTTKDFDEFKIDKIGSRLDKGIFGFGFYFTDSPYQADMYGNGSYENGNIMPVYLSIKNPYDFDNNKNNPDHVKLWGDWGTIDKGKEEAFTEWLKGRGYDGVIVKHRNQIVAFSPSQIKSATGNNGNFDPNSPNITEEPKPKYEFATDYLVNEPQTPLARGAQAYAEKKAAREGKEVLQGVREYIQDLNLPIRKFEEEVLKRGGKQDNSSKPYRDSSLSFGRQEKLYDDFVEKKMKPVLKVVADITKKSGIDGGEILPYIISKHGIERNEVMRGEELREWTDAHPDASFDEIEAKREELKDKDYAGVMAFDLDKNGKPSGNYTNPDDLARDIASEFESKVDRTLVDDLWARIKEASSATLDTWEASNQISDKQRQEYYEKFRYFVPLRGWRHDAAKELTYTKGEGFSRSLKHAEGRKSLADNPLAYMQQVQFQAIGEQVDNEVKTSMLNLIIKNLGNNEINDLATIKKLYYVKVPLPDGSYEWEPTTTRPAPELFESGDAKTKIYREHEKLRKPIQAMEHEVWVKKPGGDMVIVFKNKNLKVGQALNKQNYMYRTIFGNVYDARDINKVMALLGHANNALKALYTSWNVVFPFTNFMRDFQEASITQSIKMGKGSKVMAGYTGAFPAIYRRLMGKSDFTKKIDRDLEEFYNLGGATGYTHNKTIEEIEKDFEKDLKRMVSQGTIAGNFTGTARKIFRGVEAWNRLFEDATRFSVYLSSLAAGNTKQDAAYDAKEASVNFNRKGKGSKAWDAYFAFFNVAIQSLQKNFKLGKDYPAKFAGIATSFVMLGFLEALMNSITDDDDDDKSYYNLNPYMRQNYLVIPLPGSEGGKANKYLSVPLPQFWRGFKSIGAIAFDIATKKMAVKDGIMDALGNFGSAMLPVDIGGFYNSGEFSFAPIVPTVLKPVAEVLENKNYMGYTIKNEPFTREQKKYLADAGLGKDNVNPAAKFFTDLLFRWGGGENKYKYYYDEQQGRMRKVPGVLDINPSVVEHLFKGYTGGSGGVFSDLITTIKQSADPDIDIDFRNVPFVNRFVRKTPEAKWNIIREYYDNRDDKNISTFGEKDLVKTAEQTGDWSKVEKMYGNQYIQEYNEIFRMYESELDDAAKDKSFDIVEGSKRAIDLMEQCNSDIAKLKERYNKK